MNIIKGSWIDSARNISYSNGVLKAELKKPGGEWVYRELPINDSNRHLSYANINGNFVHIDVYKEQSKQVVMKNNKNESKILFSEAEFSNHNKQLINVHSNTELIKFKSVRQVLDEAKNKDLIIPMSFSAVKL